jgi:hypothetical protein
MSDARGLTYGLALGAGLMFLLDPRQGAHRRALIRDKSRKAAHEVEGAAIVGAKDLSHRVEGAVARLFSMGEREEVSDDVLVARVRARLGHVCAHPSAIEVKAKGNGCIELKGPVLASEASHVVSAIAHVRGVREVDDDLERHAHPGDDPALQGHARSVSPLARAWNPSTRLILGALSAVLGLSSLLKGKPAGFILGGAGVLGIARSMTQRSSGIGVAERVREALPLGGARGLREAYPTGSEWSPVSSDNGSGRDVNRATWPEAPERR